MARKHEIPGVGLADEKLVGYEREKPQPGGLDCEERQDNRRVEPTSPHCRAGIVIPRPVADEGRCAVED